MNEDDFEQLWVGKIIPDPREGRMLNFGKNTYIPD